MYATKKSPENLEINMGLIYEYTISVTFLYSLQLDHNSIISQCSLNIINTFSHNSDCIQFDASFLYIWQFQCSGDVKNCCMHWYPAPNVQFNLSIYVKILLHISNHEEANEPLPCNEFIFAKQTKNLQEKKLMSTFRRTHSIPLIPIV